MPPHPPGVLPLPATAHAGFGGRAAGISAQDIDSIPDLYPLPPGLDPKAPALTNPAVTDLHNGPDGPLALPPAGDVHGTSYFIGRNFEKVLGQVWYESSGTSNTCNVEGGRFQTLGVWRSVRRIDVHDALQAAYFCRTSLHEMLVVKLIHPNIEQSRGEKLVRFLLDWNPSAEYPFLLFASLGLRSLAEVELLSRSWQLHYMREHGCYRGCVFFYLLRFTTWSEVILSNSIHDVSEELGECRALANNLRERVHAAGLVIVITPTEYIADEKAEKEHFLQEYMVLSDDDKRHLHNTCERIGWSEPSARHSTPPLPLTSSLHPVSHSRHTMPNSLF